MLSSIPATTQSEIVTLALQTATVSELKSMAKGLIEGYSSMRKAELIERLVMHSLADNDD